MSKMSHEARMSALKKRLGYPDDAPDAWLPNPDTMVEVTPNSGEEYNNVNKWFRAIQRGDFDTPAEAKLNVSQCVNVEQIKEIEEGVKSKR